MSEGIVRWRICGVHFSMDRISDPKFASFACVMGKGSSSTVPPVKRFPGPCGEWGKGRNHYAWTEAVLFQQLTSSSSIYSIAGIAQI